MNWDLLTSKAINKVSALVANQKNCAKFDNYIKTDELVSEAKQIESEMKENKAKLLELQEKSRELNGFLKFSGKVTKQQRGDIGQEIFKINEQIREIKRKINPPSKVLSFGDYFLNAARVELTEKEFNKVLASAVKYMKKDGLE